MKNISDLFLCNYLALKASAMAVPFNFNEYDGSNSYLSLNQPI